jgi:hypothetical protein
MENMIPNEVCYTRYADDLLISSPYQFDKDEIINNINGILKYYGMTISAHKTRYGSSSGRNWNLGLMLNKDNNITIGHEKKQILKSRIYNFMKALSEVPNWKELPLLPDFLREEAPKLFGFISHFLNVEPEYALFVLTKYENKFNILIKDIYKKL